MASTLPHSQADIVAQLLIRDSIGADPDVSPLGSWPVYVSGEPNTPDNCLTVYDTAGVDDGSSMIDGELFAHEGIQVRVRAKDHRTGWTKADAIQTWMAESVYDEITTVAGADGSTTYLVHNFSRIGRVLALGKDAPTSKRSLFTVNALVTVKVDE